MRPEVAGETADVAALRARLQHVYWVGGGSGAGKSTMARRVADRHGLRLYRTDDMMSDHAVRSTPDESPFLSAFMAMDMDERWVNRSPKTMLETFHWFRGEGFGLIVDDLLRLPAEPGVVVEGFRLLPRLVKPLLAAPHHAVWLLPTPDFRRAAFTSRGSLWTIARKTSDPETALRNLLERDRLFTEFLDEEAQRLDLRVIEVGTAVTEDELAQRVTETFRLTGSARYPSRRR
jgi:2-phosphoglycerate kinase